MGEDLLKNIYYGWEIHDKEVATRWIRDVIGGLSSVKIENIYRYVHEYFTPTRTGIFGGQITAGDGIAIAAMMERERPERMIEIGIASGYSSAFILFYASKSGLLSDSTFLTSFDLVSQTDRGDRTGAFLRSTFPDLLPYWQPYVETTSIEIMDDPAKYGLVPTSARMLAFVDGGHNHPWPLMDLASLRRAMPRGSWVLMQDTQMMERWIADCVLFGTICPSPIRGVNLAVSLWPGEKIIGHDVCYNTSALRLDIGDVDFRHMLNSALRYTKEIDFPDVNAMYRHL